MACKDCFLTVRVNKDIPGYKSGQSVRVAASNGVPTLKFWRDRLRDSKLDNCVSIDRAVKPALKSTTKKVRQNDPS